jgi:hypothetical protein
VSLSGSLWERSLRRLAPRDPHWWEQLLSPQESVATTYEFRHHRFALVRPGLYGVAGALSLVASLLLLPMGEWYTPVIYVLLALALGLSRVAHVLWERSAVTARVTRSRRDVGREPGEGTDEPVVLGDAVVPVTRQRVLVRTLPREPTWVTLRALDQPRPDPVTLVMAALCASAAAGLAAAALGLWMSHHLSWVLAALGLLALAWSAYSWLSVSRDRLYVTTHRVIKLNRLFSQTVAVMPITRLVDLTVHEPWLGRLLGFGHFTFESAAQRQGLSSFHTVPDPLRLSLLIQRRALGMSDDLAAEGRGPGEGT